jgi:hypothetical protein
MKMDCEFGGSFSRQTSSIFIAMILTGSLGGGEDLSQKNQTISGKDKPRTFPVSTRADGITSPVVTW